MPTFGADVEGDGHLSNQDTAPDLLAFLQQLFACPADVATVIRAAATPRRFPAGATIVRQGDAQNETFLMVLGSARAMAFGRDGQMVLLQDFAPGDLFGAMTGQSEALSDADIVAVELALTAVFMALDFLALMERHGCIGLTLSRMLLRQLRAATDRLVERTTLSAVGRVHAELLRLARLSDGREIRPAPVLSALALQVQTTRETTSRAVNSLERRGIVRREDDALVIVAPHRLEELII